MEKCYFWWKMAISLLISQILHYMFFNSENWRKKNYLTFIVLAFMLMLWYFHFLVKTQKGQFWLTSHIYWKYVHFIFKFFRSWRKSSDCMFTFGILERARIRQFNLKIIKNAILGQKKWPYFCLWFKFVKARNLYFPQFLELKKAKLSHFFIVWLWWWDIATLLLKKKWPF